MGGEVLGKQLHSVPAEGEWFHNKMTFANIHTQLSIHHNDCQINIWGGGGGGGGGDQIVCYLFCTSVLAANQPWE